MKFSVKGYKITNIIIQEGRRKGKNGEAFLIIFKNYAEAKKKLPPKRELDLSILGVKISPAWTG